MKNHTNTQSLFLIYGINSFFFFNGKGGLWLKVEVVVVKRFRLTEGVEAEQGGT